MKDRLVYSEDFMARCIAIMSEKIIKMMIMAIFMMLIMMMMIIIIRSTSLVGCFSRLMYFIPCANRVSCSILFHASYLVFIFFLSGPD